MSEQDRIEIAVIGRTVYLKAFGFATQHNSLGIPDFVGAMFRAGCKYVAFDLADCQGMDSTFLGVVADAATASPHRAGKTAMILNADEGLVRQLRRIGLLPLVCIHEGKAEAPAHINLREIDFVHFPRTEYQKLQKVRHLHERLAELNERNKRLFGPFIAMIEEELRPQQQEGPDE
ncbi:MAG: hypothetical protein KAX19_02650 [Candidatus Brocadiae bacterium]|nr:hypothetical protein [Candidatus Brocadiia bacterium]